MGNGERKLKILLVEDNPHDATWLEHMIETSRAYPVELQAVASIRGAVEEIERNPPHCVLLDLSLPDSEGLDTVRRIAESDHHTPIVVLTGADDELGLAAVRSGAQDFLVKGQVSGDQILRHVLWAVARASVVASRTSRQRSAALEGGVAAAFEAPAAVIDADMRIVEANAAFELLVRSVGGSAGKALTDSVAVDAVFDTHAALRPVVQGFVPVARLPFPLDRTTGTDARTATAMRLAADPPGGGAAAVALVVVDGPAQA